MLRLLNPHARTACLCVTSEMALPFVSCDAPNPSFFCHVPMLRMLQHAVACFTDLNLCSGPILP